MRVLLVEDSAADRLVIDRALRKARPSVDVHIAGDGLAALSYLRTAPNGRASPRPDFVLLDLKLPRKSGLEVLREMKQDPSLQHIPVVVLSSSDSPADVASAYRHHACGYLAKNPEDLEEALGRVLAFMEDLQLAQPNASELPSSPLLPQPDEEPGQPAARPSRQLLAAIVESAADPIISLDLAGCITSWNAAATRLFGYTAPEALGKSARLLAEDRAGDLEAMLRAVAAGSPGEHLEFTRGDSFGRQVSVSLMLTPIRDRLDQVVGAAAIARDVSRIAEDISDRKRADERFRLAVEAAPNGHVMVGDKGTIVLVNAEAERMFGYPREELVGRSIDDLVPQRFRAQHPRHRKSFMEQPAARAMGAGRDLYAVRKDGTEFPVEIGLNPLETPEGTYVLSAIVDITERKQAQHALERQARELARSNEELEQFAYVASHDLREPARTVATFTEMLEQEYGDQLDEQAHQYIQFAVDASGRMQELIRDLLAYARITTRAEPPTVVSLADVTRAAMDNLRLAVQENDATFSVGELPPVKGSVSQLIELMQNLIANGLKFRSNAPPHIEIGAKRADDIWVLSVSDNGIGIPPEHHNAVFQVFRRLHLREEYPGTGIGLALCERIVERHGGRIWLESAPGQGTTVWFSLPAATGAAEGEHGT